MLPETSFLANVLGSATASIASRICTHPLDTAKARVQAIYGSTVHPGTTRANSSYRGPIHVLTQTLRTEGVAGLYRGFGAVVVGGTPGTVLYLTSYDLAKNSLESLLVSSKLSTSSSTSSTVSADRDVFRELIVHFSSGMIAEAVACVVYVPVDVIKERLQVQHASDRLAYKGSWDAVQTIARTEGIPALYKGYGATLLSFGSYSGFFFLLYEQMVSRVRQYRINNHDTTESTTTSRDIPFHSTLLCSCCAGAIASWLTSPLDMAKLRLQVQRGQQQAEKNKALMYEGVWDCLVQAYRQGGWSGLFRGAGARVLHFAPATTVTITSYEVCRSYYAKVLAAN